MEAVLKGFTEAGAISLGTIKMPVNSVEVLATPEISDSMEFSCMSPITVCCNPEATQGICVRRTEDHDFTEKLRRIL